MQQIKTYIKQTPELTEEQVFHLARLNKAAGLCSVYSLYSEDITAHDHTYIASGTCDHKCCNICNYNRQKAIRRKYFNWFQSNQTLLKTAKGKIITREQFKTKYQAESITSEIPYDLMHLTLTVPHTAEHGFHGQQYYFARIQELFNWMRKDKPWLEQVYGGEYGVETTRQESGLHIHIHSLLFVRQETQNRNHLHKYILQKWNALTVDPDANRTEFTPEQIQSILKSNKLLTQADINNLNPQGSTLPALETIYSLVNGKKVRTSDFASPAMMKAIMETISYHFEPHAFDKDNGKINIPLLADMLPHVHRKILYKKFGCLHGEKALNISATPTTTELKEALACKVDEETGEILDERQFFIMNPSHAYHPENENFKIHISQRGRQTRKILEAETAAAAIQQMGTMIQLSHKTPRRPAAGNN